MNAKARKKGFTLIELLVVIAIIAILAAILFPVFLRVKDSSKRSACLSNLRQLAVAAQSYADSFNGNYPTTRWLHWPFGGWDTPYPIYGNGFLGLRALEPYVKNKGVFFCPSNTYFKPDRFWRPIGQGDPPSYGYYSGYCYWGNYLRPPLNDTIVAVNSGRNPRALLISDIIVTVGGEQHVWNSHKAGEIPEGGNILYNDGHADWKWFKQMKKLFSIRSAANAPPVDFYY